MIEKIIEFSIRNRFVVILSGPGGDRRGHLRRRQHAHRRHSRPVGEPGHRLHRLDGPQPARHRGPDHQAAIAEPARTGGGEGGAGVERVQLFHGQRHFRRQGRFLFRPRARPGAADAGEHIPAAGRGALHGPRRHGLGANLLVHGRGSGLRPGPAPRGRGLVRPLPAQRGPRRGPGRLGGRLPHRIPDRRRSPQAPQLRRHAGRIVRGRGPLQFLGGRTGDPQGQHRISGPRRRLDPLRGRHRGHRRARPIRPRERPSWSRTWPRWAWGRSSAAACWRKTATKWSAAWS